MSNYHGNITEYHNIVIFVENVIKKMAYILITMIQVNIPVRSFHLITLTYYLMHDEHKPKDKITNN